MNTYEITCPQTDQTPVKEILRRYHTILLNCASENGIRITIKKENPEADTFFRQLLERINRELHLALR